MKRQSIGGAKLVAVLHNLIPTGKLLSRFPSLLISVQGFFRFQYFRHALGKMTLLSFVGLSLLHVVAADIGRELVKHRRLAFTGATQTESPLFLTDTTTAATVFEATSTSTVTSATGLIPANTPTETAALQNLSSSHINSTLFTVKISGHEVSVICANCTTYGELNVTGFRSNFVEDVEQHGLNFKGVHIRTELPKGLKGYIELELSTPASLSHSFTLWELPLFGFIIPGVGKAGVYVGISIPVSLQLDAAASASFGFYFSVPEGSFIDIETGDLEKSTKQGFTPADGLEYDMLPVHVTTQPGQGFNLSAALQFDITIGVQLFDDYVAADVGARLELPLLEVDRFEVNNVDNMCHPSASDLSDTNLTSYTKTLPSIGVALEVFAEADLAASYKLLGKIENIGLSRKKEVALFDSTSLLPTVCVPLHRATSSSTSGATAGVKLTISAHGASSTQSVTASSKPSESKSNTPMSTAKSGSNKGEFGAHRGLRSGGGILPLVLAFAPSMVVVLVLR